ncbi:hypothetical protein GOV11_00680 [Candidatus Woesearchaeota archaeon]|nr:hypothetical protein [Candidatus Woesearchaeota archaeon]
MTYATELNIELPYMDSKRVEKFLEDVDETVKICTKRDLPNSLTPRGSYKVSRLREDGGISYTLVNTGYSDGGLVTVDVNKENERKNINLKVKGRSSVLKNEVWNLYQKHFQG